MDLQCLDLKVLLDLYIFSKLGHIYQFHSQDIFKLQDRNKGELKDNIHILCWMRNKTVYYQGNLSNIYRKLFSNHNKFHTTWS